MKVDTVRKILDLRHLSPKALFVVKSSRDLGFDFGKKVAQMGQFTSKEDLQRQLENFN